MKRLSCALLAALMLLPSLAACSETPAPAETTDTTPLQITDTAPIETESTETDRTQIEDSLPEDLSLDGRTVRIYVATRGEYDSFIMGSEALAGDVVNEAVFDRNLNVQEQLDFVLEATPFSDAYNTIANSVSKLILAADPTYDFFMGQQYGMTSLVPKNMFVNGYDLEYVNFEEPWWQNDYMDELALGKDYRFLLVNDFNLSALHWVRLNYFNKKLYTDLYGDPEELYKEALDGTWTMDRLNELVSGAYSDLNGDGVATVEDQLGFIAYKLYATTDPYVYGSNVQFTTRDADGFIQLNMVSEAAVELNEKLNAFFHQTAVIHETPTDISADVFKSGNALFLSGILGNGITLRDMEDDFGFMPIPKSVPEQESYHSLVHDTAQLTGVSIASQNLDIIGAVLEALGAESYRRVTPAYYESAMKLKYARDDISSQVIDLIRDTMTTNFIYAYTTSLGDIGQVYRTLISGKMAGQYVSYVQPRERKIQKQLETLIATFKGELQ